MLPNDNPRKPMPSWEAREVLEFYFLNGRVPDLNDSRLVRALRNYVEWGNYDQQKIVFSERLADKVHDFVHDSERRLSF